MNNFLKDIIRNNGITPPELCPKALNDKFSGAANVEWFYKDGLYEAIFYFNNIEHIALFDAIGNLKEYRKFMSQDLLPQSIINSSGPDNEIMNVVFINTGNRVFYELIVRDKELNRSVILFTDEGKTISSKKL